MAIVTHELKPGTKPTAEQIAEIEAAAKMPIVYDEDSPEFTDEQYEDFARQLELQRANRRRGVVSIRLGKDTLEKAKRLGAGYTAVLSRMIDLCIDDKELLQKCL